MSPAVPPLKTVAAMSRVPSRVRSWPMSVPTPPPPPRVGQTRPSAGEALVAAAKREKVPLKVALIATPADLGAVPSLFGKPKVYAQFLGREIYNIYPGRLLVVMPDGYGVSSAGAIVKREQRAVEALPKPGSDGAALATAAQQAIRRIAALHGKRLPAAPAPPSSGGGHATRGRLQVVPRRACGISV